MVHDLCVSPVTRRRGVMRSWEQQWDAQESCWNWFIFSCRDCVTVQEHPVKLFCDYPFCLSYSKILGGSRLESRLFYRGWWFVKQEINSLMYSPLLCLLNSDKFSLKDVTLWNKSEERSSGISLLEVLSWNRWLPCRAVSHLPKEIIPTCFPVVIFLLWLYTVSFSPWHFMSPNYRLLEDKFSQT